MGLKNSSSFKKTYVTILSADAKFVIRCDGDEEGAVARELTKGINAGKTIYEKHYDELEGTITSVQYVSKEMGDKTVNQIEVAMSDSDSDFVLQIPWSTRVRDHFIKRIVNVDFTKPVSIKLFKDKEKGTCVMNIRQDGVTVPMSFTKNNPMGIPQPTKKVVKGVDTYDYTEVEEFLYQELQKVTDKVHMMK